MFGDPFVKVFPLEHLLQGDPAVEPKDIFKTHRAEPVPIADNFSTNGIENFECLDPITFGIGQNFIVT